jgi:hypothetical protein
VGLVAGSSGQFVYNNAGAYAGVSTMSFDGSNVTLSGRLINTYTSIASSPAKVFTGTWFTGGTSTTTKPHFLIEPTGTTSTAWSTSGTGLGLNAASGFAGNLFDFQINGTSRVRATSAGALTAVSFAGSASGLTGLPAEIGVACSDEVTNLTTGTAKVTFRMPYAMTLTAVRASVNTAPTGSTLIVDINEGGVSVLSTKLSIDASETTSTTAATAAVISDSALANDAEITIDIDQIGSTVAGKGLKVWLIGTRA